MNVAELLEASALELEERGLCQTGEYMDAETGHVCALGAMRAVAIRGQLDREPDAHDIIFFGVEAEPDVWDLVQDAGNIVSEQILNGQSITSYNDTVAADVTDVSKVLRQAAELAKETA